MNGPVKNGMCLAITGGAKAGALILVFFSRFLMAWHIALFVTYKHRLTVTW